MYMIDVDSRNNYKTDVYNVYGIIFVCGMSQKKIVVTHNFRWLTTQNIVILTDKIFYFLSINTHPHIFKVLPEQHLDPMLHWYL